MSLNLTRKILTLVLVSQLFFFSLRRYSAVVVNWIVQIKLGSGIFFYRSGLCCTLKLMVCN